MFHHFHGGRHTTSQGSISADEFDELLEFVGLERILPAAEWMDRAINGRLGAKDICLTFDDNLRCQFDIALPVLESRGLSVFWFVHTASLDGLPDRTELYRVFRHRFFPTIEDFYTAFESRLLDAPCAAEVASALSTFDAADYLSEFPFYTLGDRRFHFIRDQILGQERYFSEMDEMIAASDMNVSAEIDKIWLRSDHISQISTAGHVVGLHSHTHPTQLKDLAKADQVWEYTRNNEILSGILGAPPRVMSHPCNSYDPNTLNLLDEMGVEIGFRANMSAAPDHGRFEYPREDHANIMRMMARD